MNSETLDIAELARYLQRDARDLSKLAEQGRIPGRRVGGHWKFSQAEVNDWLEGELAEFSDRELAAVEVGVQGGPRECPPLDLLVSRLLDAEQMAVPLTARSPAGILQELLDAANAHWEVYDPPRVIEGIRAREQVGTTAWPGGIAVPHPRRPIPDALADSLVAFGRSVAPVPFGGHQGQLTDLFFLVLARDQSTHVHILARLSRLCQREGFLEGLRACPDAKASFQWVHDSEREIVGDLS